MKVISLKDTRKLVKGCLYEAVVISNKNPKNGNYFRPYMFIKNIGRASPANFTLENGNPIPEIDYRSTDSRTDTRWMTDPETLVAGDILKCNFTKSKYLKEGRLYKIDDVSITKKGTTYIWYDVKVKIGGYKRWLSPSGFLRATTQEMREISLTTIFGDGIVELDVKKDVRVIDTYSDEHKNKIISFLLFRSIMDTFRRDMDIVDWAIKKIEPRLRLNRGDFDEILKKSLLDICNENEKNQFQI